MVSSSSFFSAPGGGGAVSRIGIPFDLECWNSALRGMCILQPWSAGSVRDNSCLGTGLCKGYFGLTHRRGLPCAGGGGIPEGAYCLPELVFLAVAWAPHALHAVEQELWKFSFGNQTEVPPGAICVSVLSRYPARSTVREGDSEPVLVIVTLVNGVWKPVLKEMCRSIETYKINRADKPLLTKEIVGVSL